MALINTGPIWQPARKGVVQANQRRMESRLSYYVDHPDEIDLRLAELDHEWTAERMLQTKAGCVGLVGAFLAITSDRRWLTLPALACGFLLQHAISGSCPPSRLLRRLGFRTRREIEQERYALKALRGDFDRIETFTNKLSRIFSIVGISSH
jgi:hypothetical protein